MVFAFRALFVGFFCLCAIPNYAQFFDAEILDWTTEIHVSEGKLEQQINVRLQINNRAGEEYATIEIPYSPLNPISKLEAQIELPAGQLVRKIGKSEIHDHSSYSNITFYDDSKITEFTLKHSRYPYVIHYSYTQKAKEFVTIDYWSPVIGWQVPTRKASLLIHTPSDYKLQYRSSFIAEPTIDDDGKEKNYLWEASYEGVGKLECLIPDLSQLIPYVHVVPRNFQFEEKGDFSSWASLGNWQLKLLDGIAVLPEPEKVRLHQLVDQVQDPWEKIRRLYHDLQDRTRYVNVSIDTGGLKPFPAEYVANNKYGDCKALTNYFKAVLQEIDIRSIYTLVYAGNPAEPVDADFPAQQFNHVILCVPMQGDTIWLDCTGKGPFNSLGTFSQNRKALLIEKDNSRLVKTPALSIAEVTNASTTVISPLENQQAQVEMAARFRGEMFERVSQLDHYLSQEDAQDYFQENLLEHGFALDAFQLEKAPRDSSYVGVKWTGRHEKLYQQFGKDILVNNIPLELPDLEEVDKRMAPVQIDYPLGQQDSLIYNLPKHDKVSGRLADFELESKFGYYQKTLEVKEGQLLVVRTFVVNPGLYETSEYPDFYEFMRRVKSNEKQPLIILN